MATNTVGKYQKYFCLGHWLTTWRPWRITDECWRITNESPYAFSTDHFSLFSFYSFDRTASLFWWPRRLSVINWDTMNGLWRGVTVTDLVHGCTVRLRIGSVRLLITKGAGLPNMQIFQISHFSVAFFNRGSGLHIFTSLANQNSVRYSFRKSYFKNVAVKNVNKTFYLILLKEESLETCSQVRYKYSYFCFHCSNFGACLMTAWIKFESSEAKFGSQAHQFGIAD